MNTVTKNGCFPLCVAAYGGHYATLEFLIKNGMNVNQYCQNNGCTPILNAALMGHTKAVETLVKCGADIRLLRTTDQGSILTIAAEKGDECLIKYLLKQKVDLHHVNKSGESALHILCSLNENIRCIVLLADRGANLNATDKNGMTPLHVAVKSNANRVVAALIKRPLNVNAIANVEKNQTHTMNNTEDKVYQKMTPLYLGIKCESNPHILQMLAEKSDFPLNFQLAKENQDEEICKALKKLQPTSAK